MMMGGSLVLCSRCRHVHYCNRGFQRQVWPRPKVSVGAGRPARKLHEYNKVKVGYKQINEIVQEGAPDLCSSETAAKVGPMVHFRLA